MMKDDEKTSRDTLDSRRKLLSRQLFLRVLNLECGYGNECRLPVDVTEGGLLDNAGLGRTNDYH